MKRALVTCLVLVAALAALAEAALWTAFAAPELAALLPEPALAPLRSVYMTAVRRTVQYEEDCARYDAELGYTLRPGRFFFSNPEFSTGYSVNRAGFRDDEASLDRPEVIVAGDSIAMGWGVQQEETFAQRLEQRTGLRVLNMAVSSYGTAREMRALGRVDTSRLKVLIVQYHPNDHAENVSLAAPGAPWRMSSEAVYRRHRATYRSNRRYFPGRYLIELVLRLRDAASPRVAADPREQANAFLAALALSPRDLSRVDVIVVARERRFLKALVEVLREGARPRVKSLRAVDLTRVLRGRGHRFVFDDHPTAEGHRAIADALEPLLPR